jgi:hypothetical protein
MRSYCVAMVCYWVLRLIALAAVISATATSQDDLRDRITLSNGKVIVGRLATPHDPKQILIVQGGKRIRVSTDKVANTALIADKIREFCTLRHRHQGSPRALRYLVDWAETNGLTRLAKLQALELVLQDDSEEDLHRLLGHRLRNKTWQWPFGSSWKSRAKLEALMLEKPYRIAGERFALRCDAGLLTNVRALLDLEQLGAAWFTRFGEDLNLLEVLNPIEIRTFRNASEFPKWGFRPRAYFEPPPHSDLGLTFYAGPSPQRPEDLFFVGTQGLLYRTMIGQVDQQDKRNRVCAWLEVGLGMHMQQVMQGPPGYAKAEKPKVRDLQAMTALGRTYRLTHLVHLPMYSGYYLTDDTATAINWSSATMFVTWLLDDPTNSGHRDSFLTYIRASLQKRQGDSSTAFDRIMGKPIEQFEEPWQTWLHKLAGN